MIKRLIDRFVIRWFYKYHYLETFEYFVKQSESYPKWWRNYKWWGYRNNEDNLIYKHKYDTPRSPKSNS